LTTPPSRSRSPRIRPSTAGRCRVRWWRRWWAGKSCFEHRCSVMVTFKRQIAALLLTSALASGQIQNPQRFQLLEPGTFHGQDVRLKQPTDWVGVYCKNNACRTQSTTVRSTRVPDPLGEDDPKNPTGTSIEISTRERPLFLVRGISALPRSIATAFFGELH